MPEGKNKKPQSLGTLTKILTFAERIKLTVIKV